MMRCTLSSDAGHHGTGWVGERQIVPANPEFTLQQRPGFLFTWRSRPSPAVRACGRSPSWQPCDARCCAAHPAQLCGRPGCQDGTGRGGWGRDMSPWR